jgi:hypothetical protein
MNLAALFAPVVAREFARPLREQPCGGGEEPKEEGGELEVALLRAGRAGPRDRGRAIGMTVPT